MLRTFKDVHETGNYGIQNEYSEKQKNLINVLGKFM